MTGAAAGAATPQVAAPQVSVVVAAYNARGFIDRALRSALDQREATVEVIVVDDASADGTAEHVQALAEREPRLRLLRQAANGGPSRARNAGLAAATGDWIAVLDADDAFAPGRLARLVRLGEASGADIVADNFSYRDIAQDRDYGAALRTAPPLQELDRHTFLAGARPLTGEADFGLLKPLLRRGSVERLGLAYPEEIRHGEDFELILDALLKGARYRLDRASVSYAYTLRSSGHSRTPVDYMRMIRRCRDLAERPDIRGDARLARLMEERAAALTEFQITQYAQRRGNPRFLARLAGLALGSRAGRRWLARKIGARMGLSRG